MNQENAQIIRAFIIENFLFSSSDNGLKDTDSFLENGVIDSTGVLELISFLEEKYAIQVQDEEIVPENLDSINAVVAFLRRKREAQGLKA